MALLTHIQKAAEKVIFQVHILTAVSLHLSTGCPLLLQETRKDWYAFSECAHVSLPIKQVLLTW